MHLETTLRDVVALTPWWWAALAALSLAGCSSEPAGASQNNPEADARADLEDEGADAPSGDASADVQVASRANLKFKAGARFARDVAQGLDLDPEQMCLELGRFDCIDEVFVVTLGGVEPLFLRIYTPVEGLLAAPLAAERVALHACIKRVDADRASLGVIFPELQQPESLEQGPARQVVARRLVERLLRRRSTPLEVRALSDLYETIAPESQDVARDWSVLSCVSVATMSENLFY